MATTPGTDAGANYRTRLLPRVRSSRGTGRRSASTGCVHRDRPRATRRAGWTRPRCPGGIRPGPPPGGSTGLGTPIARLRGSLPRRRESAVGAAREGASRVAASGIQVVGVEEHAGRTCLHICCAATSTSLHGRLSPASARRGILHRKTRCPPGAGGPTDGERAASGVRAGGQPRRGCSGPQCRRGARNRRMNVVYPVLSGIPGFMLQRKRNRLTIHGPRD